MSSSASVLLVLDSATAHIHAALSVHGTVHSVQLPGGAQASSTLLPALSDLLRDAGLVWQSLDAIAFGSGPGAFTGLRTACAVTQGLAFGLGCPVISLDTLMAIAEDARLRAPQNWFAGDTAWVLQDARMDELYVGAFRWSGSAWEVVQTPQLWPLSEPVRRWAGAVNAAPVSAGRHPPAGPVVRLVGNGLLAYPEAWSALPDMASAPWADPHAVPSGAALAQLAQQAWQQGLTLDAALALPRYVRDKVAQTTAERAAARQATTL